jgi:hypothetical protein
MVDYLASWKVDLMVSLLVGRSVAEKVDLMVAMMAVSMVYQ